MKVLITGAAGFIGGHLYKKLKDEGHEVIGIDDFSHASKNPIQSNVWILDITKPKTDFIARPDGYNLSLPSSIDYIDTCIKSVDIVYHLAAQIHVDKSIKEPKETCDINILGTLNILEACRKYDKMLVFASTSEVYGTSQTELMAETHPLDAQSPYGASKVAADRLCKSYIDTYGMRISILRNFNTFGPYQNDGGEGSSYGAVIGIFTRAALRNEPIRIFGDGEQRRDYMFITDALQGYEIASHHIGVLNVGSGQTVTINELAQKIKEITGSSSEILHVQPRPGEVGRLCADITKAKSLGFSPKVQLDEGLKTYIEWYKSQLNA